LHYPNIFKNTYFENLLVSLIYILYISPIYITYIYHLYISPIYIYIYHLYIHLFCDITMKSKKTRTLKNATIKKRRYQRGGAVYILRTSHNGNVHILAQTDDYHNNRLLYFYVGHVRPIFPVSQTCGRVSICPNPPPPMYLYHGKGVLYTWVSDNIYHIYEGKFKDNQRSGKGKQTWFRTKGPIQHGIQSLHDLENMTMEQVNELMHLLTDNTEIVEIYDGQWQNDMKHGKGTVLITADNSLYVGEFRNNLHHGIGRMKFKNGMYHGYFQNGKIHGKGKMVFNDGELLSYNGTWNEGKMHGLGKFVYRNGNEAMVEHDNNTFVRFMPPQGSIFGKNFWSDVTPPHFFPERTS